MTSKEYILAHLPGMLRKLSSIVYLAEAVGESLDDLKDNLRLLIYRGCANRYTGEETAYYSSINRPIDVRRIAQGRILRQRYNESDANFETRVADFPTAVVFWGTRKGVEDETERTGLVADLTFGDYGIKELALDDQRWIMLSEADQGGVAEAELSHMFKSGVVYSTGTATVANGTTTVTGSGTLWVTSGVEAGDIFFNADKSAKMVILSVDSETQLTLEANWPGASLSTDPYECRPDDPTVRGCRMYNYQEELFIFLLKLTNPGTVDFSKEEIKEIVESVKPSPCEAWIYFPGETYAEKV